ncbi:MAG: BACON domain-containing protein, partial [Desulfamplus sp.]|nr:BACON domain-containing protein [Desulfamplus sp.]
GASGTNTGTITCSYTANTTSGSRTATVRITAAGATGSPKDVTVTQNFGGSDDGGYTQADLDAKYEAGKQYCIDNPKDCGINVQSDGDGCAILESNLDITMPCIDVFGTRLPIGLNKFTNKEDPFGYYWKLNLE